MTTQKRKARRKAKACMVHQAGPKNKRRLVLCFQGEEIELKRLPTPRRRGRAK